MATEDHVMRAVIEAKRAKRRRGWKESGRTYDPSKIKGASDEFVTWMREQNAIRAKAEGR